MITEEEKFKAETFRILGIALITPIGKIFLDPYKFVIEHNLIYVAIYLLFAIVCAIVGIIHIDFARDILYPRGVYKWKYQKQK